MAAPILVSAMAQILASNATFTYGIGAAGTYGKLAIGGVDGLAQITSPTFLGVPLAPTATLGTNTTQIATTAFVLANAGAGAVSSVFTRTGAVVAQSGDYTATQVGLGSVTNDAQTKAAIVPNTVPTAGQIHVGNAGGTAFAAVSLSGSGATFSLASTGVLTVSAIAAASVTTGTSGAAIGLLNGNWTRSGTETNSTAGAASAPPLFMTGTILTGGTATTNFPNLFLQPTGTTAATSWSTSGTGLGMNLANGFAGNFLDFHANGAASVFSVASSGGVTSSGVIAAPNLRYTTNIQTSTGHVVMSSTAPSIASGFGTSPSIVANNGTAAFTINVGTGGVASSGVITMPAATAGWVCIVSPNGTPQAGAEMFAVPTSATSITITNYTASTGIALAWPASTVLQVICMGY